MKWQHFLLREVIHPQTQRVYGCIYVCRMSNENRAMHSGITTELILILHILDFWIFLFNGFSVNFPVFNNHTPLRVS